MSDNHFITVSKQGVLMARRKGAAPVAVARAEEGLVVRPEPELEPGAVVRVRFAPGGRNREVLVMGVVVGDEELEVEELLARYGLDEAELGRWMRRAVEEALDAAGSPSMPR
ncbi:MAG: hypothetical protein H6712_35380 [Myxococcales bacterium]|nr:hypothetical protein [Myxococcales bacterium]MCB9719179.1 hypothetical protein [Myxococcales bacterium]